MKIFLEGEEPVLGVTVRSPTRRLAIPSNRVKEAKTPCTF
jgi:hypothetical protein